jgi:hypothetical protein
MNESSMHAYICSIPGVIIARSLTYSVILWLVGTHSLTITVLRLGLRRGLGVAW